MGYGEQNAYYNPEKFGLTELGMIDVGGSYEFDMFIAWIDEDGQLYYAEDSGCSCPSPFEDYTTLESLSSGSKQQVVDALHRWAKDESYPTDSMWSEVSELSLKIVNS